MVDFLIVALCFNLNTQPESLKYYPACINGLNAASIQSKFKPTLESFQREYEQKIEEKTGKTVWIVIGSMYGFINSQSLRINTPIRPIADNMGLELNQSQSTLNLLWYF